MQSSNSIVKYVFQSALSNDTRLGNKMRYILYKHNLNVNYFKDGHTDVSALWNIILSKWNRSYNEHSKRTGEHILELVCRRDSLEPWILTKGEIQEVIDLISTN